MMSGIRKNFFLGADSRYGYYSLYGGVLSPERCEAGYILKGGHGSGKNVFLQRITEILLSGGHSVECFKSADTLYLEGLFIPSLKTAVVDGDAPHTVSAVYPGAVESYIDIGALYEEGSLRERKSSIIGFTAELAAARERMYRYLFAAGEVRDNISDMVRTDEIIRIIKKRVRGIAAREFKKTGDGRGDSRERFLSASTGLGKTRDYSPAELERVCVIDNDYGLSGVMLSGLREAAQLSGYDVTVCLDPLAPDRIEHLIIPALSLSYVSQNSDNRYDGEISRHFRLDALPREGFTRDVKQKLKSDRKLLSSLLDKADEAAADAARLTLSLEEIYSECVDENGLAALAEEYAARLA